MTLWEQLQAILLCAQDELADIGAPVPVHVSVQPGEVAWDDCCDGQLWVRIIRSHNSSSFPFKDELGFTNCQRPLATQIGLGIIRCSTGLEALDWAMDPTAAALTADAKQQLCDMGALYRALTCCFTGDISVDEYEPLGPGGGCYGGEWTAWIDGALTCPPDGSS